MRVWHGFTLIFWTVLLYVCFIVILLHYSVQGSVLNPGVIKQRIATGDTYDLIRDAALTDRVASTLSERYPGSTLIDRAMLKGAVEETFPKAEVQKRVEPVIDVFYQWLDSKRPDITFEVAISDRLEQFYRALETRLSQKIASLPTCTSYTYPPEEAILQQGCLPTYVTATEATQSAMGVIRGEDSPISATITAETITIPSDQLGPIKQIPTYLNYLWALNYLMLGIAALTAVFLLVTRRLHGVIALGVAALLAGITMWIAQQTITTTVKPSSEAIIQSLQNVFIPPLTALMATYGLIAAGLGALLVLLGLGWRRWRKRRHG